ncbi:MAG: hypothetical protein AMJ79_08045 [Phycisphaerae bacterium SM23_30]|nr:MAG: hypothetical protein AMJ79_08045 [Phycisphaerae bacterium SM23_30]
MKVIKKGLIFIIAVLGVFFTGCGGDSTIIGQRYEAQLPVRIDDLPAALAAVQEKLDQDQPKEAVNLAKKWIEENEGSEFMDRALYLKGRALFERKSYDKSFEAYEELLNGYSTSSLFDAALRQEMEIARRYLTGTKRKLWDFIPLGAHSEAVEILDGIVEHWPLSELSAQALMMQADYYFEKNRFLEAQGTYQLIVDHYRKSSYYEAALLGGAEASHAQYQGPFYDSACLMEARFLYEQYRVLFPEKAAQLGIAQRIEQIDEQEAEKCYTIADFYRRTDKQGAARYYLDYLTQRWPDSIWARQAEKLLQEGDALVSK